MGKLWTFITLNIGLMILLQAAGIAGFFGLAYSFFGLTDSTTINTSQFVTAVIALFGLSTASSVIIGFFGRTSPEFAFLAPFAAANLIVFIGTFVGIIKYAGENNFASWIAFPIYAVFSVLLIGFIFSLVDWVFGRDN